MPGFELDSGLTGLAFDWVTCTVSSLQYLYQVRTGILVCSFTEHYQVPLKNNKYTNYSLLDDSSTLAIVDARRNDATIAITQHSNSQSCAGFRIWILPSHARSVRIPPTFLNFSLVHSVHHARAQLQTSSGTMGIRRWNSGRILRRNSSVSGSSLSLGLDLNRLEVVLSRSVHLYSRDRDLLAMASAEGCRIADRVRTRGVKGCGDELSNVMMILSSFLNSCTSNVPSTLVFEVHSLVGQILEWQRSYDSAIVSYVKALWIASWSKEVPPEHLARTLHQIGKVYGIQGNYLEAKKLLQRALQSYEAAQMATDHPIVVDARQSLKENGAQYWASDDSWSSISDMRLPLPLIWEEPDPSDLS